MTFSLLGQGLLWFFASKSGNSSTLSGVWGKMQESSGELTGTQLDFAWVLAGKWEGYQLEWKQNMGSEPPPAQPAWKHHRTQAGVSCVGTGVRPRIMSKQEAAHTLQLRHVTSGLGQSCCFSALVTEKLLKLGQHTPYRCVTSWPRISWLDLEVRKPSSSPCLYSSNSPFTAVVSAAGE